MPSITTKTLKSGKKSYIARIHHRGQQSSRSFPTETEARAYLDKYAPKKNTKWDRTIDRVTVGAYMHEYALKAENRGTRARRMHVHANLGHLAHIQLRKVETGDVADWVQQLTEGCPWHPTRKAFAPSTIASMRRILSGMFNAAINDGAHIVNPCKALRIKGGRVAAINPRTILAPQELKALRDDAPDPLRDQILIVATSGLRIGELSGLRPRNVDFRRGRINVVEQANGHDSSLTWRAPKTINAARTIPVPEATLEALERHRGDDDLPFFRTVRGGMWSTPYACREIRQYSTAHGRPTRWHDLRHFYASQLIDAGNKIEQVSKLMGHASVAITQEIYIHLMPHDDEKARGAFDGIF